MPLAYPSIIIAEPDADLRALLDYIVAKTYPQVTNILVSSDHDTLQVASHQEVQLVLIGHRPPALNGLTLVQHLRANHVTSPIVLLSPDETVEPTAMALGTTQFVAMPFSITQLAQVLVSIFPHVRTWPD